MSPLCSHTQASVWPHSFPGQSSLRKDTNSVFTPFVVTSVSSEVRGFWLPQESRFEHLPISYIALGQLLTSLLRCIYSTTETLVG